MENENNVSIVTNERDYTKAVTGGSFNIFKAVKISKFNILKEEPLKLQKKLKNFKNKVKHTQLKEMQQRKMLTIISYLMCLIIKARKSNKKVINT